MSTPLGSLDPRSHVGETGAEERDLASMIQTVLFIPYFTAYVFLSALLSLIFRGGGRLARTFLALYTLQRLLLGFCLLLLWRMTRWIAECILQACDCFFRTKHESNLLQNFDAASSYAEWKSIGCQLDDISQGISNWKSNPISDDFDYELLSSQLAAMRRIQANLAKNKAQRQQNGSNCKDANSNFNNNTVANGSKASKSSKNGLKSDSEGYDASKLMQAISHVFRRTFCSLHNGHLYNYTYVGHTKNIIVEFYDTLEQCIDYIANCDESELSLHEKIEFFHRCKRSLGRTALCLSGGGALAMSHCGVLRALIAADCFPKVVSGTSGGAILAGYLATKTDEDLKQNMNEIFGQDLPNKFGVRFLPTLWEQLFGAYRQRVLMDTKYFTSSIKKYVGNVTFREAFYKTGRHVSITVSYSTKNSPNKSHAHAIVLNHITSPDTLIWSAVTASCALPGLMQPQQLVAKDKNTQQEVPYYPDGVQWVDGSLQADIPTHRLQEMFRVNYFIVSQVNPHVTPFIQQANRLESARRALLNSATTGNSANSGRFGSGGAAAAGAAGQGKKKKKSDFERFVAASGGESIFSQVSRFGIQVLQMLDDIAYETVNHQLDRLVKLKAIPAVYGQNFGVLANQRYTGDVTIIPKIPLSLRFKVLAHPTEQDMREYIKIGEKATWPHVEHIYNMLRIEKAIDDKINALRHTQMASINASQSVTQSSDVPLVVASGVAAAAPNSAPSVSNVGNSGNSGNSGNMSSPMYFSQAPGVPIHQMHQMHQMRLGVPGGPGMNNFNLTPQRSSPGGPASAGLGSLGSMGGMGLRKDASMSSFDGTTSGADTESKDSSAAHLGHLGHLGQYGQMPQMRVPQVPQKQVQQTEQAGRMQMTALAEMQGIGYDSSVNILNLGMGARQSNRQVFAAPKVNDSDSDVMMAP